MPIYSAPLSRTSPTLRPAPTTRPSLSNGASGPEVAGLQRRLEKLGFSPGTIDGEFGNLTRAAVMAFQRSAGIPATGEVNAKTWSALAARKEKGGDGFDPPVRGSPPPTPGRGSPSRVLVPSATPETVDAAARAPLSNGVPIYRQGDSAWGGITLNDDDTIGSAGCAITSVAMAMSAMTGQRIDPSQMDRQLDQTNGYAAGSDSIADWSKMGGAVQPPVSISRQDGMTTGSLDSQLAAGHPVVLGVNYSGGSDNSHWMTVTAKGSDASGPFYSVNDPATGTAIKMRPGPGGALVADPSTTSREYRTTGAFVTFE